MRVINIILFLAVMCVSALLWAEYQKKEDPQQQSSSTSWAFKQAADANIKPIERRVYYRLGQIDPRFHLSEQHVHNLLQRAVAIWEKPLGKQLFFYDPNATLTINFIYDEREQTSQNQQQAKAYLESIGGVNTSIRSQFNAQKSYVEQKQSQYQLSEQTYQQRLQAYNDQVRALNAQGGVSAYELDRLRTEQQLLNNDASLLNQERQQLNIEIQRLNQLAQSLNANVAVYNNQVGTFNQTYANRSFEKGQFNGKSINIYEFVDEYDLTLVLAHELGHAIGLAHNNDPMALMYPVLAKQNIQQFQLTPADIAMMYEQAAR